MRIENSGNIIKVINFYIIFGWNGAIKNQFLNDILEKLNPFSDE